MKVINNWVDIKIHTDQIDIILQQEIAIGTLQDQLCSLYSMII